MPPELFVSDDISILQGEPVTLNAFVEGGSDSTIVTWMENDEVICENCTELEVAPEESTIYEITAVDTNGCATVREIEVDVKDGCQYGNLQIPNMISPNGDGSNDEFTILHEGFAEISLLRIYNRYGELVYETNDINQSWDGTFRGEELNPGVYVYYLEGICLNEESFIRTGNVTILK